MAVSTCISLTTEANPYASPLPVSAVNIYREYKNSGTANDARLKAFSLLGKYTEHWSKHADIFVENIPRIRITMTYIDPALIENIALNNALSNSSYMDPATFEQELKGVVIGLAERQELLFVVTITAWFDGQRANGSNLLTVNLPIREMDLINSRDMRIDPTQVDPILSENIEISQGPVSGIVAYPIALYIQNNCTWLMDQWNTTLTLSLPSVTLGGTSYASQSWSIPYRPLVTQDSPIMMVNTPNPAYDAGFDLSRISQLSAPPTPNAYVDDTTRKIYWEDMGRYLWYFLVPIIYR